MNKKTILQDHAIDWISRLPSGTIFPLPPLYEFIEQNYPDECQERGYSQSEERWRNDARWGVLKAKAKGLIESTGDRGKYRRL